MKMWHKHDRFLLKFDPGYLNADYNYTREILVLPSKRYIYNTKFISTKQVT